MHSYLAKYNFAT